MAAMAAAAWCGEEDGPDPAASSTHLVPASPSLTSLGP